MLWNIISERLACISHRFGPSWNFRFFLTFFGFGTPRARSLAPFGPRARSARPQMDPKLPRTTPERRFEPIWHTFGALWDTFIFFDFFDFGEDPERGIGCRTLVPLAALAGPGPGKNLNPKNKKIWLSEFFTTLQNDYPPGVLPIGTRRFLRKIRFEISKFWTLDFGFFPLYFVREKWVPICTPLQKRQNGPKKQKSGI